MTLFADQSRESLRAAYRDAWQRWQQRAPLQPFEAQLADVIRLHPEYQPLLQDERSLTQDFAAEGARDNPFLHMGLHLALREQVSTDRPQGIAAIHRRLVAAMGSEHAAEHRMMELLAATLWESQRRGQPADEAAYLEQLRRL
ncbi:MAG TPA: DUF1841 family protein [Steroidobacteraceae bacterium]|nr:DUF1841 family protein [Steroidobacteraceae bacterium]